MALVSLGLLALKFGNFGSLVAKNWKLVVIILLVAGIGYYHWDRTKTIEALRVEVTDLKADMARCTTAIDKQNLVIDKISSEGTALLAEERKRAAAEVEAVKQSTKGAIERLQNKATAQSCDAAIVDLIGTAHGELKWEE